MGLTIARGVSIITRAVSGNASTNQEEVLANVFDMTLDVVGS